MPLTDKITAIADAIRQKTNTTDSMTLATMPNLINNIDSVTDYFFYSRRTLPFNGVKTEIRLRLPHEDTVAIYQVFCKLCSGTEISVVATDWTINTQLFGSDTTYIRLPADTKDKSKEIIFAVYPTESVSGEYEITVLRTAATDSYNGEIGLDFVTTET